MSQAMDFWDLSYKNGWFARFSIVDKTVSTVIGTVELCLRVSEDEFNNMGILRVDVRSDYEKENELYNLFTLVVPKIENLLGVQRCSYKSANLCSRANKSNSKSRFYKIIIRKQIFSCVRDCRGEP